MQIEKIWPTYDIFKKFLEDLFLFKTSKIEISRTLLTLIGKRIVLFIRLNIIYQKTILNPPGPFFALLEVIKRISSVNRLPCHTPLIVTCFECIITIIHNSPINQDILAKQGMMEWTMDFLHHHEEYAIQVTEIACQTLENFLCHLDCKVLFQKLNLQGILIQLLHFYEEKSIRVIEFLFNCISHLLDSPYVISILTAVTSASNITQPIPTFKQTTNKQEKINERKGKGSSIKNDDEISVGKEKLIHAYNSMYHARLFSSLENCIFLYSVMNKYYEKEIIIAEISLEIIQKLALHHPKICESLYLKGNIQSNNNNIKAGDSSGINQTISISGDSEQGSFGQSVNGSVDFPGIVSRIAKFHGPYHANIAEISIHTIAVLSQCHTYLSSSAIGGISGVNLIVHTLEKQEVNHPLTAYYSLLALHNILEAEKEILLRKHLNLYYALDYSKQILSYTIHMIETHSIANPSIAVIALDLFHLLANKDLETWTTIALQHNGIRIIIYILENLFNHPNQEIAKIAIEKSLEILLWFIKESSIAKQMERLLSIPLLMNLLIYHGKTSTLLLLQFIIHSFIILYPSRSTEEIIQQQINHQDQNICELFIDLYLYYYQKEQSMTSANQIFSITYDEVDEKSSKNLPFLSPHRRSSSIFSQSSTIPSPVASPASMKRKMSFLSSSNLSIAAGDGGGPTSNKQSPLLNFSDDYFAALTCLDAIIMLTSFPNNIPYMFGNHFHITILNHLKAKQLIYTENHLQEKLHSLSKQTIENYYFYYIKVIDIIKNFLLIMNYQKKLMKEGLCKKLYDLLTLFGTESILLTYSIMDIICTLAIQYKLLLGELSTCEMIIKLIIFYNNIFEDNYNHDNEQQQQSYLKGNSSNQSVITSSTSKMQVLFHNNIASIGCNCIVNLVVHSKENKKRFLEVREIAFPEYGIMIQDFDIILYLQLLLQHPQIVNHTKLEIKEAINVLKFD